MVSQGNVRELKNIVERALIRHISPPPAAELELDLPTHSPAKNEPPPINAVQKTPPLTLDKVFTQHIKHVLQQTKGRVQGKHGAAAILGINPSTLRNRMKKLGIPYGRELLKPEM